MEPTKTEKCKKCGILFACDECSKEYDEMDKKLTKKEKQGDEKNE